MKRHITAIPALLAAIVLGACSGQAGKENEHEEATKPLVKTQTVHARDVVRKGVYTATAEPENTNNISAASPNRIKEILVDEGWDVVKGQKLVVLDDVNTASYEVQVANAKASLENVRLDYNRAVELLKIGGGTQQSVDQLKLQLTNAENTLANAERSLRNISENTVLVSPVTGVVTARNYDPGDMTGQSPILTVAQIQPVKVVINVPESELSNIRKGMEATATFDSYKDEEFRGKVTMVAPVVDSSSRTFAVEVTLPNSDRRILPGMFGRVTIDLGTNNHVVVPDLAVVKQPGSGNHYVYVYNDGKVSYRLVELGQRLDDSYELISGIDDGDEVVIAGQSKLADGVEVTK